MTQLNAPRSAKAWRDLALIALPALLLVCLALYAASRYVTPAPPKRVVMSTGAEMQRMPLRSSQRACR